MRFRHGWIQGLQQCHDISLYLSSAFFCFGITQYQLYHIKLSHYRGTQQLPSY